MNLGFCRINEEELSENVKKVPGKVYLCRTEYMSCGACCGIYNFNYTSRQKFFDVIVDRTIRFESVKRTIEAILEFGEAESKKIDCFGKKPFPEFHHCPFTGFMDSAYDKPGCLLHPFAEKNSGVDYRGLSYYGGLACASYFCPTYYNVSPERKLIVRNAIEDSYSYGLIITEDKMINNLFDIAEGKKGKKLFPHEVNGEAMIKLEKILKFKLGCPLTCDNSHPANYFFGDADTKDEIFCFRTSEFYHILKAIKALIMSKKDLLDAENFLNKEITEFVNLL
jgi:hypothetical protein